MNTEWVEYYEYLEMLRRSGVTNMYGATPYLVAEFDISEKLAGDILVNWMKNYSEIEKYLEDNNLIEKRGD